MSDSSGILLTTGRHWLLAERSPHVNNPGLWSVPGGQVPRDRHGSLPLLPSACREFIEEMGARVPVVSHLRGVVSHEGRRKQFTTFVFHVDDAARGMGFRPNFETGDYDWVPVRQVGHLPLHPKLRAVLPRLRRLAVFSPSSPPMERAEVRALVTGFEYGAPISVSRQRDLEALLGYNPAGRGAP